MTTRTIRLLLGACLAANVACGKETQAADADGCDPSIKLPDGFCAIVFADSLGPARHLGVRPNGTVIVAVLDARREQGGVVILPDSNKDGRADRRIRVPLEGMHGLVIAGDSTVFASGATGIYRLRFNDRGDLRQKIDTVIGDLPRRTPPGYTLALDAVESLIVGFPAGSVACETADAPGATGRNPCPELETSAGIWRFTTHTNHQRLANGTRIATGVYRPTAIAMNPGDTLIYAATDSRGKLRERFPQRYDDLNGASRPATELIRVASFRADYGWPYCYYDYFDLRRTLAPEYAAAPELAARCDRAIQPLLPLPAFWNPSAMLFYRGDKFPAHYKNGVFVAFFGGGERKPLPEEGYNIVFIPFKDGRPRVEHELFADGFAGGMKNPTGARYRPAGLAQGPDGSLFVSDGKVGRIWKIVYRPK